MKFINETNNTIHLHDIDRVIPYTDRKVDELDPELVKKSKVFQDLVLSKQLSIVEVTDDRIEQNLLRLTMGEIPVEIPKPKANVLFKGQLLNHSGYAKANRNLLMGLARFGLNIAADTSGNAVELNELELARMQMFIRPMTSPYILIHSTIPTFSVIDTEAMYRILLTTNESATIPQQFLDACDRYDEVWVTSDFCKETFRKAGVARPIRVIPNSIDPTYYNQSRAPLNIRPPLKSFRFLSVFGWNWRKGYDVLLRSYLEEFTAADDVSLLIVSRYQQDGEGRRRHKIDNEIKEFIAKYGGPNPPHVARCGLPIPEGEMAGIYRACHCFVLPSRGEGFGLPYLEASLCGLPVIATRHGGQTMFLNDDNSYLLDVDEMATGGHETNVHFWDGQLFPVLGGDSSQRLGKLMRHVRNNYGESLMKNRKLQELALMKYTPEVVASVALGRLEELWTDLSSY